MKKIYVDANQMAINSLELAKKIYDSGYIPDDMIGILEGGIMPTFYINEYFKSKGKNIRTYFIPTKKKHK